MAHACTLETHSGFLTDVWSGLPRFTLDRPRLKCLVDDAGRSDTKLLLLDEKVSDLAVLTEELRGIVESAALEQIQHTVTLDYACLNASQVSKGTQQWQGRGGGDVEVLASHPDPTGSVSKPIYIKQNMSIK